MLKIFCRDVDGPTLEKLCETYVLPVVKNSNLYGCQLELPQHCQRLKNIYQRINLYDVKWGKGTK